MITVTKGCSYNMENNIKSEVKVDESKYVRREAVEEFAAANGITFLVKLTTLNDGNYIIYTVQGTIRYHIVDSFGVHKRWKTKDKVNKLKITEDIKKAIVTQNNIESKPKIKVIGPPDEMRKRKEEEEKATELFNKTLANKKMYAQLSFKNIGSIDEYALNVQFNPYTTEIVKASIYKGTPCY